MTEIDWYRVAHKQKIEIDELTETVRQLREALRPPEAFPPVAWGLTAVQDRIIVLLSSGKVNSRATLTMAGARDPLFPPMAATVDAQICHMRKKLKPFGIEIGTKWGQGYYLAGKSLDLVQVALSAMSTE